MIVLGIETSCDETAVAIAERGERNLIRAEEVKSQIPLHARFGGVVPEIASRNHCEVIDDLAETALARAGLGPGQVDLLALTQGPGLLGSLLVGLSFAKGVALRHRLPLVAVDHIMAHVEAAFIDHPTIAFPLLALVVSGGHTTLLHLPERFAPQVVAKTRDDAAGEILDKAAKFLGLGYPGGPILERLAAPGDPRRFPFAVPKMSDGSNDFSFSGTKSALLRLAQQHGITATSPELPTLIGSFLEAVADYLVQKTMAAADSSQVRSIVVAGGVSRNRILRERFQRATKQRGLDLFFPAPDHCTDNASMVAWLGYEKYRAFPKLNYADLYLNSYSRALFRGPGRHR